jgi:hypothetical protein
MDWWGSIITGVVGLAGIGGTLLSARITGKSNTEDLRTSISAENTRARRAEKRMIYAKFLAACNEMIVVRARINTYEAGDPKGEVPRGVDEQNALFFAAAMSANAELELVAHAEVRDRARELLDVIVKGRSMYGDTRVQAIKAMRADLGEAPDGAYQL